MTETPAVLTKTEIAAIVAETHTISQAQAAGLVNAVFDAIRAALVAGQKVSLAGFGIFEVSETAERQGRNPATGATMTIAAGRRVGFRPATALKDAIKP